MWEQLKNLPQGLRIVVFDPSSVPSATRCGNSPGDVQITSYEPERVELRLDALDSSEYLILSDTWYPGWEALLDGQPATILRANGLFRAIRVSQGTHEIIMTYHSRGFEIGAAISLVSIGGVVAMLLLRKSPSKLRA